MTHDDDDRRQSASDRELGMDRSITRRDFLNGVAIGIGGALSSSGLAGIPGIDAMLAAAGLAQDAPAYYPPALTGMRGSHAGSFEVSHALRDGRFWATAGQPVSTGETYDLVVVGGGISGLAAAYFYRARVRSARILILDNHDDFGGHAKRNEFQPGGRLWIANGGTAGIESPFPYSNEARNLMLALGIDPVALSAEAGRAADRSVYQGLQNATFFDRERRSVPIVSWSARLAAAAAGAAHRARRGRNSSRKRRCRPKRRRTSRVSSHRASITCRGCRTWKRRTASRASVTRIFC
jgi:spermidine dehydrogenase